MARTKKTKRATSFVTLRTQKLSKGRESYYLDIYKNGVRRYEFLKLYLVPVVDEATKVQNQNTKQAAEAIRSARELEIIQDKGGIKPVKTNILLADVFEAYKKLKSDKGQSNARAGLVGWTWEHLKKYSGDKTTMGKVDVEFCKGFISYLSTATTLQANSIKKKPLSQQTKKTYFAIFASVLHYATRKGIIADNPITRLDQEDRAEVKTPKSTREFLTIEEVKKLMATDSTKNDIRRAFLFSCFTGLRLSDVVNLRWSDIKQMGGNSYVEIVMKKTQAPLVIKLNQQALSYLPDNKGGKEVFDLPFHGYSNNINQHLRRWAKKAGLEKHINYHMSRHTFATMELTMGGSLYVVSKLMGHSEISTTQIYADIINKKREETVDLLDEAFK